LQADERWGFAGSKREQFWQAEVIDPATRLVVAFATGVRNGQLIGSSNPSFRSCRTLFLAFATLKG